MPSLTHTLNTGYRAVLHMHPRIWGTKHLGAVNILSCLWTTCHSEGYITLVISRLVLLLSISQVLLFP